MAKNAPMQLFFSYGHDQHSVLVTALAEAIKRLSNGAVTVWIDKERIHRDSHWREEITKGVQSSDSVIAFLSSHSAREESVCRDELSIAIASKHGMIRTILLEKDFTPPAIVTEYQWGDLSDYPAVLEEGEAAFQAYVDREAKKIIALVSSDEIRQYGARVKQLRGKFGFPNVDALTKFDQLLRDEIIGRDWLFRRVQAWADDAQGQQIMMLYGKPGAGKSMFSAHLQMRCPNVVAAFPCDCRSEEYSETGSIIRHIAYRLALRLPDYMQNLLYTLNDPNVFQGDDDAVFRKLIATPLSKLPINGGRSTLLIVVDALDEMKSASLAEFISEYAAAMPKHIRFLITARREPEITAMFEQWRCIDLDAEDTKNNADLRAYYVRMLGAQLKDDPGKEAFLDRLVAASESVFTYLTDLSSTFNLTDLEEATFLSEKALKIAAQLAEQYPESTTYQSFHSQVLSLIDTINTIQSNRKLNADKCIQLIEEYTTQLEENPDNLTAWNALAAVYYVLYLDTGDKSYLDSALEIARKYPELPKCKEILEQYK